MENRWAALDKRGWKKAKKIAKTAARLFSRKGYLETSMNEIAAAAKISKGGLYHYVPGKAEILFFILSNYMDEVLQNLEEQVSHIREGEEKLLFIISRHIDLYARNLPEAKVLLHEAHCLPGNYFKIIAEKERRYYHIVARALPDLFTRPLSEGELTAVTFTLFGMCNWIYSWYDPRGAVSSGELSRLIYGIFMNGVRGLGS